MTDRSAVSAAGSEKLHVSPWQRIDLGMVAGAALGGSVEQSDVMQMARALLIERTSSLVFDARFRTAGQLKPHGREHLRRYGLTDDQIDALFVEPDSTEPSREG